MSTETKEPAKEEAPAAAAAETGASWVLGGGMGGDMTGDSGGGAGGMRFWCPKSQERRVIFLTEGDKAFGPVWEHNFRLDGRWTNWVTCLEPLGVACPFCKFSKDNDGMFRRYKAVFFTIIDTHEFEDRSGKKRSNVKRLFVAKKDTLEKLQRKYFQRLEAGGRFRGALFNIYRGSSEKSPSVGDDFDFVKDVDLDALPDTTEFDYLSLLKPDPAKIARLAARLSGEAAPEGAGGSVDYD